MALSARSGFFKRIAIGYPLASILEIWIVKNTVVDSTVAFMERYSFQMGAAILLGLLYMLLLYGLYVPNWTFDMSASFSNRVQSIRRIFPMNFSARFNYCPTSRPPWQLQFQFLDNVQQKRSQNRGSYLLQNPLKTDVRLKHF